MYVEEQAEPDWSLQCWPLFTKLTASYHSKDGKNIFKRFTQQDKTTIVGSTNFGVGTNKKKASTFMSKVLK